MKPDKRDMPNRIAVAALGAVLLGSVVYQMVGKGASAAPPPAAPKKEVASVQQPMPAAGATTDARVDNKTEPKPQVVAVETKPVQVAMALPASRRDPFAPCMTPPEFQPPAAAVMPRIHGTARLPSLGTGSLPPFAPPGANNLSISPTGTTTADVTPKFVLTGVIDGNTRVAIIRADSERHIVREGQLINGKYFVRSVGRDGVLLTHGSQRIYLKLGGASNAS